MNAQQANELLTAWQNIGIAMAALLVLGLAIVGFILDKRQSKNNGFSVLLSAQAETTSLFKQIIDNQQATIDEQEKRREVEHDQTVENDKLSFELYNRIGDAVDKIAQAIDAIQSFSRHESQRNAETWGVVTDKLTDAQETLDDLQKRVEQIGTDLLELVKRLSTRGDEDTLLRNDVNLLITTITNLNGMIKDCIEAKTIPLESQEGTDSARTENAERLAG